MSLLSIAQCNFKHFLLISTLGFMTDLCCLNTFLFALQTSTFTHGSDALDLSDGLYDSDAILDLHIPEGIASRGGL